MKASTIISLLFASVAVARALPGGNDASLRVRGNNQAANNAGPLVAGNKVKRQRNRGGNNNNGNNNNDNNNNNNDNNNDNAGAGDVDIAAERARAESGLAQAGLLVGGVNQAVAGAEACFGAEFGVPQAAENCPNALDAKKK